MREQEEKFSALELALRAPLDRRQYGFAYLERPP